MIKTKIFKATQIDEVVSLLKNGGLVALPTETVYGLAADALNEAAIQKIFKAKGRPSNHPLIVHIDSFDKIDPWCQDISIAAKKLADNFWPGSLTMIFNKRNNVSNSITGGLNTIAIRIPNHPVILEVISKLGNGIAAPSANAHQKTSPTSSMHVLKTLDGKIAGIVDSGVCAVGIESTIIDMTKEIPIILRPGAITVEMIEKVLGINIENPIYHNEKVSGNMKNHYQPEKPLFIFTIDQIESLSKEETNIAIIHYSKISKTENAIYYTMPKNKAEYTKIFYSTLHSIDNTNVAKVLVETPPSSIEWADINDRLIKASAKAT